MRQVQTSRLIRVSVRVITLLIALGSVGLQQASAQQRESPCTLETLEGRYIFAASGYNIVPGNPVPVPKTVVEFLTFNGDGSLTSIATAVVGGALLGAEFRPGSGTYTVNEDCTGKLTFSSGLTFDLYIERHEGRVHMIQVNPGQMLEGEARRVNR
jgi:hypothetical protein